MEQTKIENPVISTIGVVLIITTILFMPSAFGGGVGIECFIFPIAYLALKGSKKILEFSNKRIAFTFLPLACLVGILPDFINGFMSSLRVGQNESLDATVNFVSLLLALIITLITIYWVRPKTTHPLPNEPTNSEAIEGAEYGLKNHAILRPTETPASVTSGSWLWKLMHPKSLSMKFVMRVIVVVFSIVLVGFCALITHHFINRYEWHKYDVCRKQYESNSLEVTTQSVSDRISLLRDELTPEYEKITKMADQQRMAEEQLGPSPMSKQSPSDVSLNQLEWEKALNRFYNTTVPRNPNRDQEARALSVFLDVPLETIQKKQDQYALLAQAMRLSDFMNSTGSGPFYVPIDPNANDCHSLKPN